MATIRGNERNNLLEGTGQSDEIYGLGGEDTLLGRGGDDVLFGGAGRDTMDGGNGSDTFVVAGFDFVKWEPADQDVNIKSVNGHSGIIGVIYDAQGDAIVQKETAGGLVNVCEIDNGQALGFTEADLLI